MEAVVSSDHGVLLKYDCSPPTLLIGKSDWDAIEESYSTPQKNETKNIYFAVYRFYGYSRGSILENGLPRSIYANLFIVIFLSVIVIGHLDNHNKNIFKRGYLEELVSLIKDQGKLALSVFGYIFIFSIH